MVIGQERINKNKLLHAGILQHAQSRPEDIALKYFSDSKNPSTCEIVEISYGELLEKSKRIAYYLKKQGIKKGDGVAISLNRGVE